MKAFILLQALIIAAAVTAGAVIRSKAPDAPADAVKHFEDVRSISFDVVTVTEMSGRKNFSAFEGGGWFYDENYSPCIFVCRAEDSLTCGWYDFSQRVTVEKRISGSCPAVGEAIELTVNGGIHRHPKNMYFYNEYLPEDIPDSRVLTVLDLEGLNFMKPGHSYLVACQTTVIGSSRYYGTPYGAPCWLDLADNSDKILTVPAYEADYAEYADNEFFCSSRKELDDLIALKKRLFDRYGLDAPTL